MEKTKMYIKITDCKKVIPEKYHNLFFGQYPINSLLVIETDGDRTNPKTVRCYKYEKPVSLCYQFRNEKKAYTYDNEKAVYKCTSKKEWYTKKERYAVITKTGKQGYRTKCKPYNVPLNVCSDKYFTDTCTAVINELAY